MVTQIFGLKTKEKYLFVIQTLVTEIMGKTAIWAISCPPLNNVEKQRAKFASSYVMGLQHCIGVEANF